MTRRRPVSELLTAKQLELLDQFLLHDLNYLANPATLRKDSRGRISKAWAREACDRLVDKGILVVEERRPRKQRRPTRHYRLNHTPEGFISLVLAYTGTLVRMYGPQWPWLCSTLLESTYARDSLTPDFVRGILAAKEVEIRYFVDRRTGSPRFAGSRPADWSGTSSRLRDVLAICFPVSRPGESFESLKNGVHYFSGEDTLGPSLFDRLVNEHYEHLESRLLVLPILGLLQVSPTAVLEFLGDWEPYKTDFISGHSLGFEMVEHVLFGLIFAAIGDLAITRSVPYGLDVTFAEVRPEHGRAQRHEPALLQLSWRYREIIGFEAGFDTEHLFVAGGEGGFATEDISEVTRNPENCWARIWWDRPPPRFDDEYGIEKCIGYTFEDGSLLDEALTHSTAPDATDETRQSVKRLAWLGDAILGSVATSELFGRLGPTDAQLLHKLRVGLTSNAALATVAERIGLPSSIRVGEPLEQNPTAVDHPQMHATHVEAIIGAAFLDGGLGVAQGVVRRLLGESLEEISPRTGLRPTGQTPDKTLPEGRDADTRERD